LPIPQRVVEEVVEIGSELFPDVAEDNIHGLYLEDDEIPPLPLNSEESFEDEDEAARGICPLIVLFFFFFFFFFVL